MANAARIKKENPIPFRGFLVGYPGSGKTGALAPLADAGYRILLLDFDGNPDSLLNFTSEKGLANIDILHFEDKLMDGGASKGIIPKGIPTAFNDGLRALIKGWITTDADGNEVDLGTVDDWGPETIVVLDSANTMGDAAFLRTLKAANRTSRNTTHAVWGSAMADQEHFIKVLGSKDGRFHVIVLSHLKLIGPDDIQPGDETLTKEIKETVAQIVPHRLYPWVLGQKLAPKIGGLLPSVILAEAKSVGKKVKRVLVTTPRPEIDIKVPAKGLPAELPIETGMLDIFKAMGHTPPEG